jgi:hypothetical protein
MPDDQHAGPPERAIRALRRALSAHERAIVTHQRAARLFTDLGRAQQAEAEWAAAERERDRRDQAMAELTRAEAAG